MSDITFQFSAEEKDVLRALEATGKGFAAVRDQITKLTIAGKEQGTAELALAKQRSEALAPIIAKQKELKAVGDSLTRQMKEGKISTEEYNAKFADLSNASNELKVKLQTLQAQLNEDAADMKKAAGIIGQTEDKTQKYTRAVAELNRMKEKGILTSAQHSRALEAETKKLSEHGQASDKSGGLIGGLTGKMSSFVTGLGALGVAVRVVKLEYDALIQRQGKSRDANLTLGAAEEQLINNLGGADANKVIAQVKKLSATKGINQEVLTQAVTDTLSAKGDMGIKEVMAAVGSVSKVKRLGSSSEMAGLSAAVMDTRKQTGLGTDESLGFLFQLQDNARTKSLNELSANIVPAVGGVMKLGTDRQTAGALLASLSHGMGDSTGANSATAALSLADQLRQFSPGQDIGKTIASLQQDENLRKQFIAGASFEVKARPSVEGLLSGRGKEAADFATFRKSMSEDPVERLRRSEKDRRASGAITVAETQQKFSSALNRLEVDDKKGATSAIIREFLPQIRERLKGSKLEAVSSGMIDDLFSQGDLTIDDAIKGVSSIHGQRKRQMYTSAVADGAITAAEKASLGQTDKLLSELITQLKALRSEQAEQARAGRDVQQARAHAGAAVGRRNNQGEGVP